MACHMARNITVYWLWCTIFKITKKTIKIFQYTPIHSFCFSKLIHKTSSLILLLLVPLLERMGEGWEEMFKDCVGLASLVVLESERTSDLDRCGARRKI